MRDGRGQCGTALVYTVNAVCVCVGGCVFSVGYCLSASVFTLIKSEKNLISCQEMKDLGVDIFLFNKSKIKKNKPAAFPPENRNNGGKMWWKQTCS